MKFYRTLDEEKAEYGKLVERVLANDGEEIKKVMLTKNESLISFFKKAVEHALEKVCGKPLFPNKIMYRDFLVMLNNAANVNLNFARYIKRDIEDILIKLYPNYRHELNRLANNKDKSSMLEKVIIYIASTEKKLLNQYFENPCYDPSRIEYESWLKKQAANLNKKQK